MLVFWVSSATPGTTRATHCVAMPPAMAARIFCSTGFARHRSPPAASSLDSGSGAPPALFRMTGRSMPNLTLNLGLRYEYDQPWYEQNNKTGNIDLTTGQVEYADQSSRRRAAELERLQQSCLLRQPTTRRSCRASALPIRQRRGLFFAEDMVRPASLKATPPTSASPPLRPSFSRSISSSSTPAAPGNGQPVTGGDPRTVQQGFTATSGDCKLQWIDLQCLSAEHPAGVYPGMESDDGIRSDHQHVPPGGLSRRAGPAHRGLRQHQPIPGKR